MPLPIREGATIWRIAPTLPRRAAGASALMGDRNLDGLDFIGAQGRAITIQSFQRVARQWDTQLSHSIPRFSSAFVPPAP
jgi:hypothetical protein